jgi:hypothetical protein
MSYESNLSKPTIQHNVPISLGGKHEIDNISVICNQCNSSIQNRQVTEPYNTEMVKAVWERIGNESGMYTQDRIGKERIGKDNNSIYLSAPDDEEEDEFSTGFSTEFSTQDDRERLKTKIRHGELFQGKVILSDAQMDDLLDKLSYDEFNHYVGVIVNRIDIGKPFKRKTHYQAILDMAMQDRKLR